MKLRPFILIFFLIATSQFAGAKAHPVDSAQHPMADSLVNYARSFVGVPYVWAGASPSGFDCSGFVSYVFSHFGYSVERTSSGLAKLGKAIELNSAVKGDVLLFRGTNPNDRSVGHIGIVISTYGEPLRFIHASSSQKHFGVVITDYLNSNYPDRFIAARRILV